MHRSENVNTSMQSVEPMPSAIRDLGRRLPLSRRSRELELLDAGRVSGAELRTNLADLARLNRLPGGATASADAIAVLVGGRAGATVVDVGTGAGDLPLAFAERGWTVTALDADPAIVAEAAARVARDGRHGAVDRVRCLVADASELPLDDASVDVAHASLLLHHLDSPAAVAALAEMARVARLGVVINDLRRGVVPLMAVGAAVATLGRCRTTRHDGLLSVRRAYTPAELDELLHATGLRAIRRSPPWLPRIVITAVWNDGR